MAALLRASRAPAAKPGECAARLRTLGVEALPALLDVLCQERVPAAADADLVEALTGAQRELVLGALARLPAPLVRAELRRRLSARPADADPALRLAAVRVLGLLRSHADLPQLALLVPRDEAHEVDDRARDVLRASYAAILRADAPSLEAASALFKSTDASAGKQLLYAFCDSGDKRTLALLQALVQSDSPLAQQAVSLVPRAAESGDPELEQAFAAQLCESFDAEKPEWTRAALRAVGLLGDAREVPALIGELGSGHRGLRDAALGALQQLSGQKFAASAPVWSEWFARESAWNESERPAALEALRGENAPAMAEALETFVAHPLYRDQSAADVAPLLEHADAQLRLQACGVLARLGSKRALAPLVEQFGDEDDALAEAAWRAASALAGKALPRKAADARAALGQG